MNERPVLVLAPFLWREELPALARGEGRGLAVLRRNFHDDACEFIARSLQRSGRSRGGFEQVSPLVDVLLVVMGSQCNGDVARQLAETVPPVGDRSVVALCLGTGAAVGQWAGIVRQGSRLSRLAELRLVGPGMQRFVDHVNLEEDFDREHTPFRLEKPEENGTSRTRGALGDAAWRKLRGSTVAVVGAGRNGSGLVSALGLLGVQKILLIDPDRDEPHNRDATPLPNLMVPGRPKVCNRRSALAQILPDFVEVDAVVDTIRSPEAIEKLRRVDLIATAVDHDGPRLAAAVLANRWVKPHLDVGTGVLSHSGQRLMGGDVRLCLPGEACVACLGGLPQRDDAEYELAAPRGALARGPFRAWHDLRAGSLLTINQVAVHLGVQLWLDLLAGRLERSTWYHIQWDEAGIASVEAHQRAESRCHYCGRGS